MNIFFLLKLAIDKGVSDVHITADSPPIARLNGSFVKLVDNKFNSEEIQVMAREISGDKKFNILKEIGEIDLSISLKDGERFRINIYKQKGNYAMAIRIISSNIPAFESLELPQSISKLIEKQKGLILVTGPTGCGKSTTLASLIDIINTTQEKHIITLEDPIEYIHNHKRGIVNQREIGNDTQSFSSALRSALRQDPDILFVGEMRDIETVSIALRAAETGHLVLSTLHTIGSAKTIDRIIDMFPVEQQQQIRMQISTICEGIICQQLIPSIDEKNRVPAVEVMIPTPAIRNLIRENKTYQIQNIIQTSNKLGMQTMDQSLVELYKSKSISQESVLSRCSDYEYTNRLIRM